MNNNPLKIHAHWKERIAEARKTLGDQRANEILASLGPASMRVKAETLELEASWKIGSHLRYKRDVSQRISSTVATARARFQKTVAREPHQPKGYFEIREANRIAAEQRKARTDLRLTHSEFMKLRPYDRGKFLMAGGKIADDFEG